MIAVHDLNSNTVNYFDYKTDPAYAVRYCQATETLNLASWFFACIQYKRQAEIEKRLPVVTTQKTVSCGDWCATL